MQIGTRFPFFCPSRCRECCRFDHLSLAVGRSYRLSRILEATSLTPSLAATMFRRTGPETYFFSSECRHYEESSGLCKIYYRAPWACRLYPLIVTVRARHFALAVETGCPPGEAFYKRYRRGSAPEQRFVQRLLADLKAGKLSSDAFVSAGSVRSRVLARGTLEY